MSGDVTSPRVRRAQSGSGLPRVFELLASVIIFGAVGTAPALAQTQTALQFNGTNQYVTFGAAPSLGVSTFTVEVRFKRTGPGIVTSTGTGGIAKAIPLFTKGRGEAEGSNLDMNFFLGVDSTTSRLAVDFEEGTGQTSPGLNHPLTGVTVLTNNTWYHAAATFDGSTLSLYLNGVLENSITLGAGHSPQSASIQHAGLGTAMTSAGAAAGFFQGVLEEPRLWNVARSASQVFNDQGIEVAQAAGLIARWGLNEGAGTVIGNSMPLGIGGTFGPNAPTWVADATLPLAATAGIRFGNLATGGTNAYMNFGNADSLRLSAFTIELWARRDSVGLSTNTGGGGIGNLIPLLSKGRAEAENANADINYIFGIRASDGVLCADFEESASGASPGLNHPVFGSTPILPMTGTWHHVAATYDGSTWKLYLDGVLDGSLSVGRPPNNACTAPVVLGSSLLSTGLTPGGYFNGALDEVRVWKGARTQAEIVASMNSTIAGLAPNLMSRWGLNEDAGTVVASTAGTTINGTIAGTNWGWGAGSPFNAVPPPAPADPTGLSATAVSSSRIDLSWTDAADNETGYEVERSTAGSGGPFSLLETLGPNASSYSNTGLSATTEYCYRVRAVNAVGTSNYTTVACATTLTPPPPADPTGLAAVAASPLQIDLAWTDNATDETGYEVERSTTGSGGPFTPLVSLPAGASNYSNTGLTPSTEYCYRVRAVNGSLVSNYAPPACATTLAPPADPTDLAASASVYWNVHLTWTDNAADETGYSVERSVSGAGGPYSPIATLAANAVAFDDANRDGATEYCYRVRALGALVSSGYATAACVTTPAATPGALDLAGSTYVTFGDPAALDLASFTIECWFRRDGAGATTTTGTGGIPAAIPLLTHGAPEADGSTVDMNYFLGIRASDGVLCADFEEGAGGSSPGLNHPVTGTTPIPAGSGWHHAAATYDGTTWKLYLDANLEATLTVGQPVRSNSIQRAALGTALTSSGATNGFFDGALDEARVWSAARTQAEILATANSQLAGTFANLAARWGLDEGTGTAVHSNAGTAVDGTITGPNFTWTAPAPFQFSYTITASAGPGGSIAPSGAVSVNQGADQSFTITPNTGYHIADVLVDGASVGAVAGYALTGVTANHTIAATFAINTYTLAYTAGPGGTIAGTSPQTVAYNGSGTQVTAAPDVGYHFVSWSDGVLTAARADANVTADLSVTATFAVNTYTLSYVAGPGGTIVGTTPQTVSHGADGTEVTAVADANYHFVNWSDGVLTAARTDLNVTADRSVTANFESDALTLTYTAGPNGSISGTTPQSVTYGGSGTEVTAVADANYHFVSWSDGVLTAARTDSNVTANLSVTAIFAINTYTILASAGTGGSIAPANAVVVNHGADQAFSIAPDAGYHIADVVVDGSSVGATAAYTFSSVTADHTIAATFALNVYTITASAGPNGSISPSGPVSVSHGGSQSFTISPNPGYHVLNVLVDGGSVGAVTSYDFTGVTADRTIAASFEADFDALDFAGTNAYANFGNPAALKLSTFTIEMWMRRDGTGTGTNTGTGGIGDLVPLFAKGRAEAEDPIKDINYIFGFQQSTGVLGADFEEAAAPSPNPSLNHPVLGTAPLAIGSWYHVAATYDGNEWRLYRNGLLDGQLTVGRAVAVASDVAASLASALNSTGLAAGFFDGAVDEVRVWNTARTSMEIGSTINERIDGPTVGLVARWGLDEGSGTVLQSSAGTTLNGALSGTGFAWGAGAPFNIATIAIASSAGTGGSISPNGDVAIVPGSSATFTITPDSCHDIADVLVDGLSVGAVTTYTFSAVSEPHTIAAAFSLKQYTITATAGANGGIAPAGAVSVSCGSDQTFTITPSAGYHVESVLVDGSPVGAVTSYTFAAVTAAHTIAASFAGNGGALALGGTNAYVNFGNPTALKLTAFTIEMWMRRDGTGVGTNTGSGGIADLVPLLTKGRADAEEPLRDINYFVGFRQSTGVLGADFEEGAGGASPSQNHPVLGTTPIAIGTWYHVAATYDGNTWRLYLNGSLDGELAVGRPVGSGSDVAVALGSALILAGTPAGFFQGALDEVRVWSSARSATEILDTINDRITTPSPNLVARWAMDEGAGTTVPSTAGTPLDGSIVGSAWNWTAGAPFNITPPESLLAPTGLVASAASATQINLTWIDNATNETGYEIERSTSGSGGPFTALALVGANATSHSDNTTAAATAYCYRVRAVNTGTASDYSDPACATTPATPSYALSFSGNTYVGFGDPTALDLPQFTIECWFRRDGTGTTVSTGSGGVADAIPLVTHGTSQSDGSTVDMNFFLGIKDGGGFLCADFEEGASGSTPGLNHPIVGTTPLANGVWHHGAATYDGTTWRLYLDGNLEGVLTVGQPVQSSTIQQAALASSITSTGTAQGFFVGALDEVRVWNVARSLAQIQAAANAQLASPVTGMVARWALDEGTGTAVNGSAGTSVNGTVTGTSYAWVAGAPFNLAFNLPPNQPVLITPSDNATGVFASPSLGVSVSDPDGQPLTVTYYGRSAISSPGPDFTIVGMPDTQYYTSELNGATNALLLSQTNWIVANRASRNIAYVATLGDCVEHGDNGGNDVEWRNAEAGYSLIENPGTTGLSAGIPYGITVGNHDQSPIGDADGTTNFYNQYFGVGRFTGRPYYGGHYGTNNDNWYDLFSASGMDFVVISLEYDTTPDAAVLSWADGLLTTYADRRAIILSHNFAGTGNPAAFSTQGQATYDALKGHTNLFLMLCGHVPGEGRRQDTFGGNTIYTVMSDYQGRTNGGNGWLRTMEFSPANNVIRVRTYSPSLDQSENDADSQFDLPYLMSNGQPYAAIGMISGAASGTTTSFVWSNLAAATPYEWYATVGDGAATVSGPTWHFTTTATAYTLTTTADAAAGGTATKNPDRPSYAQGATVTVTASPVAGWEFRGWAGDLSGAANPALVSMNASRDITAIFNEIGAPVVQVLAPNGGESFLTGATVELQWSAADAEPVGLVDVLLSRAGSAGPFETVAAGLENSGAYAWVVSGPPTSNAFIKVVAHNSAAPVQEGWDVGDARFAITSPVTGVDDLPGMAFAVKPVAPNPMTSQGRFAFALPMSMRVRLEIYDVQGRLVTTLADRTFASGYNQLTWTGKGDRGHAPAGVYFFRLTIPGKTVTKRFVLVR